MPKRLRYTEVLGLNARGLTRHQKRQIVWKKHVKGKFDRSQYVKPTPQKRVNATNTYWDKYHDEQQRFEGMGLKEFLSNPSKILKIPQKQRKIIYKKLVNAQLKIEYLKYKYSVAIPDKKSLKILSVLGKGQGIIQMKTSNHCNGYWSYLLSQKNVSCKIFNAHNTKHLQLLSNDNNTSNNNKVWNNKKNKKNKHKNLKKSKKILAAEANEWIAILNKDSSSKIHDILKDYSQFVLLMIYPDFMMDTNVINKIMEQQNNKNENKNNNNNNNNNDDNDDDDEYDEYENNGRYEAFGSLIDNKECTLASVECLKAYKGNYVVHIGELFGCTYNALNPWGRTSSMQFQIELQTNFHKVYQHEMSRWPMFRDTLTIWRRNKITTVGNEQIVCLQDTETNDSFNTKYWQSIYKQRISDKNSNKNIFEGANYAIDKQNNSNHNK